jgi:hypothetical protein
MRNKSLELELEEILKSEEEIVDENINHLMWLIAFNFFCTFVIAFSMYKIGVAPKVTVVFLFLLVIGQIWASINWFGGDLLKPLIIIGFTLMEFLLIACFSIKNLDETGRGKSIGEKYNGRCASTTIAKSGLDENGKEVVLFYFNSNQIDKAIERVLITERCSHL